MARKFRRRMRRRGRGRGTRRWKNWYIRTIAQRQIKMGTHYFKRTLTWGGDTITPGYTAAAGANNGTTNVTGSYVTFQIAAGSVAGLISTSSFTYDPILANLPNLAEYTNLFDAYQIRKVVFKIIPLNTVATNYGAGSYGDISVLLHTVIDHDSATMPAAGEAGIADLQQYPSYKCTRLLSSGRRPVTIVLKPRAQATVHSSAGAADASELRRGAWIDLAYPNVPYYGLRGMFECISPGAAAFNFPMRCETTYYVKLKGPR